SQSHTDSGSHTDSYSRGVANSVGENWSTSRSSGTSQATGQSSGTTVSSGQSVGQSWAESHSEGVSSGLARSESANWSAGQSAGVSVSQGESVGSSWGVGHSEGQSAGVSAGAGSNWSSSESQGASQGSSVGVGVSESVSQVQGVSAGNSSGWSAGTSEGSSFGVNASASAGVSSSVGGSESSGTSVSQGTSSSTSSETGASDNWSSSTNIGASQGVGGGANAGVNGSVGIPGVVSIGGNIGGNANANLGANQGVTVGTGGSTSTSQGVSSGVNDSISTSATTGSSWNTGESASVGQGMSAGVSQSVNHGVSGSESLGMSQSAGHSLGTSLSAAESSGTFQSSGESVGGSQNVGVSQGVSSSNSVSVGGSQAQTQGSAVSNQQSASVGGGSGTTSSVGQSSSTSSSVGGSSSTSSGVAQSTGTSSSQGSFQSTSSSVGGSRSTTNSESWGSADSVGWADSRGTADTSGTNRGWFNATSQSRAVTRGVSDTESWAESVSESWSEGRAVSRSQNWGRAHSDGTAVGEAIALGAGRGFAGGLSAGLVPGVSLARAWQTEDDVAIRLTEITRGLESLLNQASMEGGFLTSALLFVGNRGERAAQALIPQAFHGPTMPTPVLTVAGDESLRQHALAFRPSLAPEGNPFGVDLLWSRWGTLLAPGMLAAYTAPNLFEEGTTVTVQEKMPPLAFYSELKGDVVLGHLVSPETGDLTRVPLRLSRERHFHTAFCGDTGYGKSVAAERMVYETTLHWQLKTIVLDFGAGWRKLMNAPGLEGRVEIRQLSPGGVRPLRWNPLQIGRTILPEVQWRAFCDIFGSIAKLGQRRQVHELRDALRQVYLKAGVLVDDPECRDHAVWGVVHGDELSAISGQLSAQSGEAVTAGLSLEKLTPDSRQLIAVRRSSQVGLTSLYSEIEEKLRSVPPRDSMLRGVLEGILFRLHPLVQGAAAVQYAAGPEAVDINEIVPGEWGVAVLEGGAFLDDFSKAFLLGWAAWHLYTDAVILRMRRGTTQPAHIQIVFEEANKILSGLDSGGSEDESGQSTAEQFANMWRDSRKYGIWLHLITQSPSLIPPGILSSCNNIFIAQLKHPKDRDLAIAAIHRSEKGLVDETWRRFLASLPVARSVAKLGYSFERSELEPTYVQPLMLDVPEPSDGEIDNGQARG
ncbi:serine-rich protein, partial [bacterium]|nr:serine-rich protein [bacterium]